MYSVLLCHNDKDKLSKFVMNKPDDDTHPNIPINKEQYFYYCKVYFLSIEDNTNCFIMFQDELINDSMFKIYSFLLDNFDINQELEKINLTYLSLNSR